MQIHVKRLVNRVEKPLGQPLDKIIHMLRDGEFLLPCNNQNAPPLPGDVENVIHQHPLACSSIRKEHLYTSSVKTKTEIFGRRVIHSLLDQFLPAALLYDTDKKMSFIERRTMDTVSGFYKSMYHAQAQTASPEDKLYLRILMITDFISGMTDNYANRLYRELNV